MVKFPRLYGILKSKYNNMFEAEEILQWKYRRLYRVLNGEQRLTLEEILQLCEFLSIPREDILPIFFDDYVSKYETIEYLKRGE